MSDRRFVLIALAAFAFGAAGCGEKPQVTVYKQGMYQGKPDTLPWQGQPFNGSRGDWEKAIDGRTQKQNEYIRIGN